MTHPKVNENLKNKKLNENFFYTPPLLQTSEKLNIFRKRTESLEEKKTLFFAKMLQR